MTPPMVAPTAAAMVDPDVFDFACVRCGSRVGMLVTVCVTTEPPWVMIWTEVMGTPEDTAGVCADEETAPPAVLVGFLSSCMYP